MNISDCWYKEVCNLYPSGCNKSCLRFIEMEYLLQQSNLPEHKWFPSKLVAGKDINQFRKLADIKNDILQWVKEGNNLYLYSSNFGNGKTSWAIKLMLAYFNNVWAGNGFKRRGVFISVPEFLDRNREVISNRDEEFVKMRTDILDCDIVIWDDIASIKLSDFNHSMLLNYLDARMLGKKSNIFTGNADYQLMTEYVGGRLASRIWNTSEILELTDIDKRGSRL